MFDAYLSERPGGATSQWTRALVVTALVYGGLLVATQRLAHPAQPAEASAVPVLVYKVASPRPPKGVPAPATKAARPVKRAPARKLVLPEPRPLTPAPAPTAAPPEPSDATEDEGDPSGELGQVVGTPDGSEDGTPGATGAPTGGGEDFVSFGAGMVLPRLLSGPPIVYTREALEAHVTGSAVVKCIITAEGDVRRCRAIKGVPLMTETVIAALEGRKYTPVRFQGEAVNVSYVFNIQLQLP